MSNIGQLIIISAPSGTGKSTIIQTVKNRINNIGYAVSHTSRLPRDGENNCIDYFFVSESEFEDMITENAFVEWAKVYNSYYGTSFNTLSENTTKGLDVILDIDPQGAANIRTHFKESILIFILPPSIEILQNRLLQRGKDSESVIKSRMTLAEENIKQCLWYDYVVINDDLEKAVTEVCSIIIAERKRTARVLSDETLKSVLKLSNL